MKSGNTRTSNFTLFKSLAEMSSYLEEKDSKMKALIGQEVEMPTLVKKELKGGKIGSTLKIIQQVTDFECYNYGGSGSNVFVRITYDYDTDSGTISNINVSASAIGVTTGVSTSVSNIHSSGSTVSFNLDLIDRSSSGITVGPFNWTGVETTAVVFGTISYKYGSSSAFMKYKRAGWGD